MAERRQVLSLSLVGELLGAMGHKRTTEQHRGIQGWGEGGKGQNNGEGETQGRGGQTRLRRGLRWLQRLPPDCIPASQIGYRPGAAHGCTRDFSDADPASPIVAIGTFPGTRKQMLPYLRKTSSLIACTGYNSGHFRSSSLVRFGLLICLYFSRAPWVPSCHEKLLFKMVSPSTHPPWGSTHGIFVTVLSFWIFSIWKFFFSLPLSVFSSGLHLCGLYVAGYFPVLCW